MMQTHLRVGDRPRFNDGEGSTGGSRCVVRPEKKAHRIGRPLRVAGRGALHYAMNSTQPTTPCGNPTAKGVPPAQQKNGYQAKSRRVSETTQPLPISAPDPSAQPSTRKTVECDTWWRKLPGPPSPKKVRGRFIHASRPHMAAPKLPHFCHPPSTGCRKERSQVYAVISR
jgi:hypothetical protein